MAGKVVAIVAPTRSGKSFLTEKLADFYGSPALYEVEGKELPQEVRDAIRVGTSIDSWLYFRNRVIDMQLEATKLAQEHAFVFLDASWVSLRPYITFNEVGRFHQNLLASINDLDCKVLPWPDIIVLLTCDDKTTEKLWRMSGKDFEMDEKYFAERVIPLKRAFEKHVEGLSSHCCIIKIDRSPLDFAKPEDLKIVTEQINNEAV